MSFQIRGLDAQGFQPLFTLSDEALDAIGARRLIADEPDAYPCRISLERAMPPEELLLVNYTHLAAPASPYRAAGPIFVGRSVRPGFYRDELPPIMRDRLLSLRAYTADGMMIDADVGQNADAMAILERFLDAPPVAHVDAHFARRGCFAARILRA